MALPQHLVEFERRVAARLSDAVDEMRRTLHAKAEQASSQLLNEFESFRPEIPERLLGESDLAGLDRPTREATRIELARELRAALAALDGATTQGAALEALLTAVRSGASSSADRAALWLTHEGALVGWGSSGFATNGHDPLAGARLDYALAPGLERLASGRATVQLNAADAGRLANALDISTPASAVLVPIVLRDRLAAALYVDRQAGDVEIELVQLLAHAAAQRLELQGLSDRAYSPTLFLENEAPHGAAALPLWSAADVGVRSSPDSSRDDRAEVAAAGMVAPTDTAPVARSVAFEEFAAFVEAAPEATPAAAEVAAPEPDAADTAGFVFTNRDEPHVATLRPAPAPALDDAFAELDADAFEAPIAPVEFGLPALDAAPSERLAISPAASAPEEASAANIAWELEEADSTVLMSSGKSAPIPAPDLDATDVPIVREATSVPVSNATVSFPRFSAAESPVRESTAEFLAQPKPPELRTVRPASIATHEFPLPDKLADVDAADDATMLVRRSPLPSAEAPAAPVAAPAFSAGSPTIAIPISPSMLAAPTPPPAAGGAVVDDEPTITKNRSTEVVPPPDLQGPGWAFTANRAQRATGENALHEEARRLARLLISEIKLYNEEQVEEGRRNRDVYLRLKEDIDRSRQIYEERVHESVRGTDYFQQELVRSLAGGDARALGI